MVVHFHGAVYVPVLPKTIRVQDVHWICERLNRLSGDQLRDAFRAAGYSDAVVDRYAERLKQKITEGLAVR